VSSVEASSITIISALQTLFTRAITSPIVFSSLKAGISIVIVNRSPNQSTSFFKDRGSPDSMSTLVMCPITESNCLGEIPSPGLRKVNMLSFNIVPLGINFLATMLRRAILLISISVMKGEGESLIDKIKNIFSFR